MPAARQKSSQNSFQDTFYRVQRILQAPDAQSRCQAIIHRSHDDNPAHWHELIDLLDLHEGVSTSRLEGGKILVRWERPE